MARSSHPKKEVEEALRHAEEQGWHVEVGGSQHEADDDAEDQHDGIHLHTEVPARRRCP